MADALDFKEAYRTHEFSVEIDGIESPNINKVMGLTDGDIDPIEQKEAGIPIIHKISSGIVKFGDLTLERHMDGSDNDKKFHDWFSEMFKLDGVGKGSSKRRNGSVVLKLYGEEKMRFVFEGAWIKSSKFTDLEGAGNSLMKQTIILAVERMYRK